MAPQKRGAAYVEIPIAQPLRGAVAAVAGIDDAYILNDHGAPFESPDSYRNRAGCDQAGLVGRSSHGVHKTLTERLAEEGCGGNQIMAVLSHTQPGISAICSKRAERRTLAAEAMRSIGRLGR